MSPSRIPPSGSPLPTPSAAGPGPSSSAVATANPAAPVATSYTLELPQVGIVTVLPRTDLHPAHPLQEAEIRSLLDSLLNYTGIGPISSPHDAQGGRSVQYLLGGDSATTLCLDSQNYLRELIQETWDESGRSTIYKAQFQPRPAAMLQPPPPTWVSAIQTGSASTSGHKRPLSPPAAPQANRQRVDTGTLPVQGQGIAMQQSAVSVPTGGQPPLQDNNEAHAALPKDMQYSAQSSASQTSKTSVQKHSYLIDHAKPHWRVSERAKEFSQYMEAWCKARNPIGNEETKGGKFLQYLSSECDEAEAAKRVEIIEDTDDLRIVEFTVPIEGLPAGTPPLRVWRGVNRQGGINLHVAPLEGEREKMRKKMQDSAQKGMAIKKGMLAAGFAADSRVAGLHWDGGSKRASEFEQYMKVWSMNLEGTDRKKGTDFLRHLSSECDKAEAAESVKVVKDEDGLRIVEFTVPIEGLPAGIPPLRVWRGVNSKGGINLRVAPLEGERATLLHEMQLSAHRSIFRKK